jgi:hypothetical protein
VPHQVGRGELMHRRTEPARDAAQRGGRGGLKRVGRDEQQEQRDGNRAHHRRILLAALK